MHQSLHHVVADARGVTKRSWIGVWIVLPAMLREEPVVAWVVHDMFGDN